MPIYSFKCTKCEKIEDKKLSVDERNNEFLCECGEPLERTLELPAPPKFIGSDFTPKFYK